ncbi:MAG: HAD family hydrolase [Flavobacterium sp.]|uniref:heavy metal translocating P-type ATPase n=1 Tax=Flavobacterium sp. TaxID=239 RepID=UPI00120FFB7B|nr:heavy metal translocating P-type ATPase metal-binding domain-containing protein [Flavobacterium sp.]RZJ68688.1 MAG: HAD family hydrolase [Flavobacterium sp.]
MTLRNCFHCGLTFTPASEVRFDEKSFCCNGCKTVYEIFSANDLSAYYDIQQSPGATPLDLQGKYDFLENEKIVAKLLEFDEGNTKVVSLHIPHIHCSSCIYLLENLHRLASGVVNSVVNFRQKSVRIAYHNDETNLKSIVTLLCKIGYEPNITLDDYGKQKKTTNKSLTIKLGVAFFCFGNIMLLSFPEYFEVNEFWLDQYKGFFRLLIFVISLPAFLYSASEYYSIAWKSIKSGFLSIEIPIALGIVVMFARSVSDMFFNHGPGFFDSMAGLIFFMLLGKTFQAKTYDFLSFERDYKSYFPVAVTQILSDRTEVNVPIYEIQKGNRILVRNQEIIPCDGILISGDAKIDYSFVTGEAIPVSKISGDKIFAGGRHIGIPAEIETLCAVSQSYLTQLWSHEIFRKSNEQKLQSITDSISRYFTPALLLVAISGFLYWCFFDMQTAWNVFTAVLIVACPCALALTAPFTLGNLIRIIGRQKLYLKNASVLERMARADTIVFDKTGTLTTSSSSTIAYQGTELSGFQIACIKKAVRASNHPLSRMLYDFLPDFNVSAPDVFEEIPSHGIHAIFDGIDLKIGSASFTDASKSAFTETAVHINCNGNHLGKFIFSNQYRSELPELLRQLNTHFKLAVLSGDNEGERKNLQKLLPRGTQMAFDQTPEQKLEFIKNLQGQGKKVIMIGDGLNDAGALAQSDVGISIAEDINIFSPACDAILDASAFGKIANFLALSRKGMLVIKLSFGLSLLYNVVGLSFAFTGNLLPLVAAIIMPLSTITIVSFVTLAGNIFARTTRVKTHETRDSKTSERMINVIVSAEPAH